MKTLYKIIIFLAVFQVGIVTTNALGGTGIFPYQMYSDYQMQTLEAEANPIDVMGEIFLPSGMFNYTIPLININFGTITLNEFTFSGIIAFLAIFGAGIAMVTHHYAATYLLLFGLIFIPMVNRSIGFFRLIFEQWNVTALIYLGVMLFVAILTLVLIHIAETTTHGRS